MKRVANVLPFFPVLFFLMAVPSLAQESDDLQQGIKAYGTYRGGDIDSVSMTSGSLNVKIPLVSYPQRGKLRLGYSLLYNGNKNYRSKTTCVLDSCTQYWIRLSSGSVAAVSDDGFTTKTTHIQENPSQGFNINALVSPDGANHTMATLSSGSSEAVDATGISSNMNGILAADGVKYGQSSMLEDPNGNQLGSTDTVGRTIPTPPLGSSNGAGNCPTGPLPVYGNATWTVPGPNGGTSTFLFCFVQISVVYSYDITDGTQVNRTFLFLQTVVLPNGTAWTFQYSNDGNGDLTQITFPTGGTISYVWTGIKGCSAPPIAPRWAASRTVNANDGTGSHTWTYSYSTTSPPTTTVVDPLGNNSVYTNTSFGPCGLYTTAVNYYQGAVQSSNLLKTVSTTYSSTPGPFEGWLKSSDMNVVPVQITTTWPNGKTTTITKTYDSGFSFPSPDPQEPGKNYTGIYGKVVTEKDYDYGNGGAGPLLKQTNYSYAWQSPNPNYSSYLANNMLNLVYSVQVTDGTTQKAFVQYGHDEYARVSSGLGSTQNLDTAPWTGNYRGNVTSVNRWLNLPSAQTLTSTTTYYDTGMASVSKDPLLNQTTYQYSSTFQDAYVTQITNALSQNTFFNYDYNTGLLTSTTDPNNQVTTSSYDADWRLVNVTRPTGGGQTSFCYTDLGGSTCNQGGAPYQVVVTKAITSSKNSTSTAIVDGLDRLSHTQLNSDPEGVDYVDLSYDAVGNKATDTNPYRSASDTTYGTDTTTYDALHRATKITKPDGSIVQTAYCANTTLVTDEAGHWRRSTVDGLGRLIEVDEPNSPTATVNSNGCPGSNEPIWVTTYGYDTLGSLTSVVQAGSRQRSFTYDSLSRLLTATNPESNTLSYTYDADGNVSTKVTPTQDQSNSANKTTISYCYDPLNRLTGKAYAATAQSCPLTSPVSTYSYDGSSCLGQSSCSNIGHRTGMTDAAGSESWAYDAMGRVMVQSRMTNNVTKTTSYTYNLDSSVATLTYPSGRVVTYTPDTAGRPSSVQDNFTSIYYATGSCTNGVSGNGICYAPQGAIAQIQNGSSLVSTHIYNDRLQPCWMYSTTGTPLAWSTTPCTGTATAGNMLDLKYNFNLGADNGNPLGITNNRVTDRSQSFTYDQLNRIATGQTTATHATNPTDCWGQAFGYDSTGNWGNLLSISAASSAYNGCTQGGLSVTVNANNQITSDTYDAAGNLWVIPGTGGATYLYNAENQLTSTSNSTMNYLYDGDGNRVEKSGSKLYWYSGGEVLDETDTTGSATNGSFNEYMFFAGKRIARRDSSGNVFYYLADHLGTSRVIAEVPNGQTTATLCYDADYEPFGTEHAYTNTCSQNYKFTGKERDTESGLDNFGARYYGSSLGRFMQTDPKVTSAKKMVDPQQWNMYPYVRNNPLALFDPDGKEAYFAVQGSNITVQINVLLTGNATPRMAAAFQQSANRTLGGPHQATVNGQNYNVSIQVNASTDPKNLPNAQARGQNTLNIDNNAFKTEVNADGKTGTAKTTDLDQGNVPGHESLHFAGLKDEYVPGAVNTLVNGATGESFQYQNSFVLPGTENNVMANPENPNSQLTQQNVNQLANTAIQIQQQQAPPPAPEKKEEQH